MGDGKKEMRELKSKRQDYRDGSVQQLKNMYSQVDKIGGGGALYCRMEFQCGNKKLLRIETEENIRKMTEIQTLGVDNLFLGMPFSCENIVRRQRPWYFLVLDEKCEKD